MTKKPWQNPVSRPAKEATMNMPGNFEKFTETMRTMLKAKPEKKRVSRVPAA